jgi:endonuclease YncB( thermonuclease family)
MKRLIKKSTLDDCFDPICEQKKLEEIFKAYDKECNAFSLNGKKCWGRVVDVYDGDTIKIILPIFGEFFKFSARLYGIDTAEIKSDNEEIKKLAKKSKERLIQLISDNSDINENVCVVWVECLEWDKYGRLLINIYKRPGGESYAKTLIKEKVAYEYDGGKKKNETEIIDAYNK